MIRLALVATLLLLVALATVRLVGGGARRLGLLEGPQPSDAPTPPGPLPVAFAGPWLAERPQSLSLRVCQAHRDEVYGPEPTGLFCDGPDGPFEIWD